jgi:putative hydrolase of the HAD superfamily
VPSALILDLDGVVRIWDAAVMADAERVHGLPCGSIARVAFEPGALSAVITGRTTDEAWRRHVARALTDAYGPQAKSAVADWSASCGTVNVAVLDIVRAQRRVMAVALLTNATSRLARDLAQLGLDTEFDAVFNSSEMGVAKPDPRTFEMTCAALELDHRDCLFVDDNVPNVEAAQRLGLGAHLFRSARGLAAFLGAR